MYILEDIVLIINDSCCALTIFVINQFLQIFHEVVKFFLILFMVYSIGMAIFDFWDAVLEGRLQSSNDLFRRISRTPPPPNNAIDIDVEHIPRNPPPSRNSLIAQLEQEVEQSNRDVKHLLQSETEFEQFIKAELRSSQMSLDIQPRSSYFEHLPNTARVVAEEDMTKKELNEEDIRENKGT
ncbi:uncharacterized protein [Musca autumnalis]|uniref:uncharacterized protein n=1 Tax=Musca autumnalis TaxID=221902 RepID=UPI003CE9FE29